MIEVKCETDRKVPLASETFGFHVGLGGNAVDSLTLKCIE
jgi:hypothetical protein